MFFSRKGHQSNDDLVVKHEKPLDQIRVFKRVMKTELRNATTISVFIEDPIVYCVDKSN